MISEPLADEALKREIGARYVIYAEFGAIGIAEIKFREIAVKVTFAAMLVDALHAALEHAEEALDGIGGYDLRAFVAAIFLGLMVHAVMAREVAEFIEVLIPEGGVGHDRGVMRHVCADDRQ